MARGRMVSHTVATDKRLNSISEEAELAFLKTVPHLDRDGIIIGDPVLLAAQVCPRRPKLGAMMEEIIQEWIDAGLVIRYDTDEDPLLFFPGFSKNQIGLRYDREPASLFPPPPGYYRNGNGLEPVKEESTTPPQTSNDNPPTSGNLPADIRQPSGTLPPEVEVKVEDQIQDKSKREDQDHTAGAREGNGTASLSQPKFAQSSQPLVPHKPRMDGNGTSSKPAQPPLETDSPHLDPRRFVNGYIRPGTGDNPIEAFYERHSIREHRLSAPMEDDIARAVTDLDLWRKTLAEWDRHGYRPSNIQGQLEWYANGGKANASGSNKRTDSGTRTTQDGYIDLATYTSGRPLPPVNRIKH